MTTPSNDRVKSFILEVLDDNKRHDWDDAMIEVDQAFSKGGEPLGPRQSEECLAQLIATGLVIEEPHKKWTDFLTLRRVKPVVVESGQMKMFSEAAE